MVVLAYSLLVVHVVLLFWAIGGFLEMFLPEVFWHRFTNPDFPDWLLFIHWGSVLFSSATFIFGYLTHWKKTPQLMIVAYLLMALVCVVETFGYMTSDTKYLAMIIEFTTYILILLVLYKTEYFKKHFTMT